MHKTIRNFSAARLDLTVEISLIDDYKNKPVKHLLTSFIINKDSKH